ncbi:techylectin-5A-like isoform X2 [Dermacentor variabilis]|uniref:techylectin-5A-like isoform X2 n=1 Tax=Dermacentor variabilis TaxID=34621 RepID=UPI003F5BCC11
MIWSVASLSLVVLCSVSSGSGAKTAAVAPTTLAEAGKRVEKLADLFSDIRGNMRPRHCADLLRAGQTTSGLYDIFIGKNDVKGKVVYCDMDTDGGGWTVIQRRGQFGNRVYYFYRNWKEYAAGFGDPAKEFWFGESASVDYEGFKVGSEKELFKLSLGRFLGPKGWNSLKPCNNSKFTTLDKDNDGEKYNCAVRYRSGWWHNLCHMANPNGLNLNGAHESYADGIEWSYRNGSYYLYHYSYPSVTIMLRPLTMDASCKSRRPH